MDSSSFFTARTVCQQWLDAVNARDLDAVVALYAADAVLMPTFSPHVLRTEEQRRGYFASLAQQAALHVSLHEKTFSVQATGSIKAASGIYCFRFEIDGEPLGFEARFSYVIDQAAARPILHHHSSQIPRNLS
jgi:hypothetical protein